MQKRIKLYVTRYVIYIIVINLAQLGIGQLGRFLLHSDKNTTPVLVEFSWLFGWTWLIANLIMASLVYSDMQRLKKLNWWILIVVLINKEFGAIVSLLYYFINDKEKIQV